MLAHAHGDAATTGTTCAKTCTLPQPVQRHDELRAKKPAVWPGVITRPFSPRIVSISAGDIPEGSGPSIARARNASTYRLHCNTASRADSILPMARTIAVLPRFVWSAARRPPCSGGANWTSGPARNRRVSAPLQSGKAHWHVGLVPTLPPWRRVEAPVTWDPHAKTLHRVALAAARPASPELFDELVREMAASLGASAGLVAVFTDETQTSVRTMAALLDGKPLAPFEYALAGTPCEQVVGKEFRHVVRGLERGVPREQPVRRQGNGFVRGVSALRQPRRTPRSARGDGPRAARRRGARRGRAQDHRQPDRRRARARDDRGRAEDRRARGLERARRNPSSPSWCARWRRSCTSTQRSSPARRASRSAEDESAGDAARRQRRSKSARTQSRSHPAPAC